MSSNDFEVYFAGTFPGGNVLNQDPIFFKATLRPMHGLHTITYKIVKIHVVYYGQVSLKKILGNRITAKQFDFNCRGDFESAKNHLTMLLISKVIVYEMKHKNAVSDLEFAQSLVETA